MHDVGVAGVVQVAVLVAPGIAGVFQSRGFQLPLRLRDEDGEFRPRCVYPDSIKAADFFVTDQMRTMFGVE